jgi:hypothetical protein
MPSKSPFTWMPSAIVEISNPGPENLLLTLASGTLRLDANDTLRVTASALHQESLSSLISQGKVKVQPYKRK